MSILRNGHFVLSNLRVKGHLIGAEGEGEGRCKNVSYNSGTLDIHVLPVALIACNSCSEYNSHN